MLASLFTIVILLFHKQFLPTTVLAQAKYVDTNTSATSMETCWHSHHFTLSDWKLCPKPSTILRQSPQSKPYMPNHIANYTCQTATQLNTSQRQTLGLGCTPWTHCFPMAQKVKHLTTYSKTHATHAWGRRQMGIIRTPPKVCHIPTVNPQLHFLLHSQDCELIPLKASFVTVSSCPDATCVMWHYWGDRNKGAHPKYLTKVQLKESLSLLLQGYGWAIISTWTTQRHRQKSTLAWVTTHESWNPGALWTTCQRVSSPQQALLLI